MIQRKAFECCWQIWLPHIMSHHQNSRTDFIFFPKCWDMLKGNFKTTQYEMLLADSCCILQYLLVHHIAPQHVPLNLGGTDSPEFCFSWWNVSRDIFKKKVDKSFLPLSTFEGQITSWYSTNSSVHGRNWMGDSQCSAKDKWCCWFS